MHGVVLGSRDDFQVFGIRSLHARNKCNRHSTGEKWIFAVGLLPASPAGVAKDVDVRRPERQPEESFVLIVAHGLVVLSTRLSRDGLCHRVYKVGIPRSRHADDLREIGGVPSESYTVQSLIPPIVLRNAKSRDSRRPVAHLRDLLFQSHSRDQVTHALIDR